MDFHCFNLGWIFLVFILLPAAYQGTKLREYDLVIANGNNIMIYPTGSPTSSGIPSRTNSLNARNITVIRQEVNKELVSVATDPERNVLYFSTVKRNSSSISMLNLESNQTTLLYTGSKGSIGSLTYFHDHLYWCNEASKSVMRLDMGRINGKDENNNNTVITAENETETISVGKEEVLMPKPFTPEIVFSDEQASFEGLAIHPVDGTIFYTKWDRSNRSQILSYSMESKASEILVSGVYQPHGLYADDSHLYWIDNIPGINFNVERVSLFERGVAKEVLFKGQHQHPYSLAVECSKTIYWTDRMNKILWEFDIATKNMKNIHYFKASAPYGVDLVRGDPDSCGGQDGDLSSTTSTTLEGFKAPADKPGTAVQWKSGTNVKPAVVIKGRGTIGAVQTLKGSGSSTTETSAPRKTYTKLPEAEPSSVEVNGGKGVEFCKGQGDHCFNGGTCLKLEERQICICQPGFMGPTCSEEQRDNQVLFRTSEISVLTSSWSSNPPFFLSCTIFSVVAVLLLLIILVLALKVRRLGRKPRINRRIVVAHRPSTSEGPGTPGGPSVCEMIDIENCCNMNICETPCYERVVGSSVGSNKGRSPKRPVKDDKKCLLSS